MLILAGVTINLVLGEDGIISKAQQAGLAQKLAEYKDKVEIAKATVAMTGTNYGKVPMAALKAELERLGMTVNGDVTTKLEIPVEGKENPIEIYPDENGNAGETIYPEVNGGTGSGITGGNSGGSSTPTTVAVSSITLNNTEEKMLTNGTVTLTATVSPSNASDKTVNWTSSNEVVATVNNGEITGLTVGKTTITATAGGKTSTCEITVWDSSKVAIVESADGIQVPVPLGFTASSVSITDGLMENTVSGGFVIYENTASGEQAVTNDNYSGDTGAQKTRNQLVWVPVDLEETPMFTTATDSDGNTITVGQLYNFGTRSSPKNPATQRTYSTTSYHEPQYIDGEGTTEDGLQQEFLEMKQSVETYGGFYIGRYETGNISQTNPVVVKGNSDISSQTWVTMYSKSKSIVQNTTATTAGIQSRMIWGCQWDATLNWFLKDENLASWVTNSEGGNYVGTQGNTTKKVPTGYCATKNIYDMAGNVWDWTLEVDSSNNRVYRGGSYNSSASGSPAEKRSGNDPTVSYAHIGFRVALYM